MKIQKTKFDGLVIVEPTIYEDDRGIFYESFNASILKEVMPNLNLVQENISHSKLNVLRGLHFQIPPYAQAKLVSVLKGKAIDVVVDLRKDSESYGQSFSIELSETNKKQLYVPRGFAHGFVSLADHTIFSYKCDNHYEKNSERTLAWNDESLKIDWIIDNPILSEKDMNADIHWNDFESPF